MNIKLDAVEVRILGCLIEKELTTPDYYPLTLNALINACNQKSNRNPVVEYDETTVEQALVNLRKRALVMLVRGAGIRVSKFRHYIKDELKLALPEMVLLAVLMLRGPQTIGELRGRTERMYDFKDLDEVEQTLAGLMTDDRRYVTKLPRQVGHKENRFAHLLSGEPVFSTIEDDATEGSVTSEGTALTARIEKLEATVETMNTEMNALKQAFEKFKSQFE